MLLKTMGKLGTLSVPARHHSLSHRTAPGCIVLHRSCIAAQLVAALGRLHSPCARASARAGGRLQRLHARMYGRHSCTGACVRVRPPELL